MVLSFLLPPPTPRVDATTLGVNPRIQVPELDRGGVGRAGVNRQGESQHSGASGALPVHSHQIHSCWGTRRPRPDCVGAAETCCLTRSSQLRHSCPAGSLETWPISSPGPKPSNPCPQSSLELPTLWPALTPTQLRAAGCCPQNSTAAAGEG